MFPAWIINTFAGIGALCTATTIGMTAYVMTVQHCTRKNRRASREHHSA